MSKFALVLDVYDAIEIPLCDVLQLDCRTFQDEPTALWVGFSAKGKKKRMEKELKIWKE